MADITDLNDALGKALLEKFFEPIPSGVGPNGEQYYMPSGVSILAGEIYKAQATKLLGMVWEKIDIEDLAAKIAELVAKDLMKVPSAYWNRNQHQEDLKKRVLEVVAQQLGQRVVDSMGLQIEQKELH